MNAVTPAMTAAIRTNHSGTALRHPSSTGRPLAQAAHFVSPFEPAGNATPHFAQIQGVAMCHLANYKFPPALHCAPRKVGGKALSPDLRLDFLSGNPLC